MSIQIESFENQKKLFETAAVLMRAGKIDDAITIYDYLLIQDPAAASYWTAGGMAKMKRGHLDEALASFQVAEAADEHDPVPIMMRGLCLLRMGKEIEALIALKRALLLAGGQRRYALITDSIGRYLERLQQKSQAVKGR